ncbi:MAG: copper-binding protein [Roseovarius sp.]|nr:copper-binding protein [Roseovarius sp.]
MRKTLLTLTALILSAPMALAQTDHSSGMNHGAMAMDEKAVEGAVHAQATVNSIKADSVNVTHGPIPEIGWPAMTMDMPLLDGAEIGAVEAGDTVMMMLEKGHDGMFGIRALMPGE